jgi:hypothetical protein
MTDQPAGGTDPGSGQDPEPAGPRCPWCSASIGAADARCPSCGAAVRELRSEDSADIPGVTRVDPFSTARRPTPQLTGLIGWLAGAYETATGAAGERPDGAPEGALEPGSSPVGPPSDEVRREMRRLEMRALQAEIDAEEAEARAMGRLPETPSAEAGADELPPPAAAADEVAGDEAAPGDLPPA